MSKSLSREGRSGISALSPTEVGEELSRMGLGSNLVSILQENGIAGADLLTLTNADLERMGIQEWYSRNLVMRMIAYMQASEEDRQEEMLPLSRIGEDPPTYSHSDKLLTPVTAVIETPPSLWTEEMAAAAPNDCKVLADAFSNLGLIVRNDTPAICCTANLTDNRTPNARPPGGTRMSRIVCLEGRIITINLQGNALNTGIPSNIDRLDALDDLNLASTGLYGSLPSALGSLRNLRYL
ncbi:hypothetical protein HDU96_002585, partial [Phlyctochytrium bullatum]